MTTVDVDFVTEFGTCRSVADADSLYRQLFWAHDGASAATYLVLSEAHRRTLERLSVEVRVDTQERENTDPNYVHPYKIRNWAFERGIPMNKRGKVPMAIETSYREEHGLSLIEGESKDPQVVDESVDNEVLNDLHPVLDDLHPAPSEKTMASLIRVWAHEAGVPCGKRGRIGPDVIEAYNSAHNSEES